MNNDCTICNGRSSSSRGNENIVGGAIMCDYCRVRLDLMLKANPEYKSRFDLWLYDYTVVIEDILQHLIEKANKVYG